MAQLDKEKGKIIRDLTILQVILEQISGIFPTYQIKSQHRNACVIEKL